MQVCICVCVHFKTKLVQTNLPDGCSRPFLLRPLGQQGRIRPLRSPRTAQSADGSQFSKRCWGIPVFLSEVGCTVFLDQGPGFRTVSFGQDPSSRAKVINGKIQMQQRYTGELLVISLGCGALTCSTTNWPSVRAVPELLDTFEAMCAVRCSPASNV